MWSADEGTGQEKQRQRAGLGVLHPGGDLPAAGSQGTLAALLCQRGWCPHLTDRGKDIFVHIKSCNGDIAENDVVSYEVEETPKGLSATKVSVV